MKYKVLRDLLWFKKGEIIETNGVGVYECGKNTVFSLRIIPDRYPLDFAPISEEEEGVEEYKGYLGGNGYLVAKKDSPPNDDWKCDKCRTLSIWRGIISQTKTNF